MLSITSLRSAHWSMRTSVAASVVPSVAARSSLAAWHITKTNDEHVAPSPPDGQRGSFRWQQREATSRQIALDGMVLSATPPPCPLSLRCFVFRVSAADVDIVTDAM